MSPGTSLQRYYDMCQSSHHLINIQHYFISACWSMIQWKNDSSMQWVLVFLYVKSILDHCKVTVTWVKRMSKDTECCECCLCCLYYSLLCEMMWQHFNESHHSCHLPLNYQQSIDGPHLSYFTSWPPFHILHLVLNVLLSVSYIPHPDWKDCLSWE